MLSVSNVQHLRPGDVLYRSLDGLPPLLHFGVFAGYDHWGRLWVFDHCEGERKNCRLTPYEEFSKGYQVSVECIPDKDRQAAVARMRELLSNPRQYDILGFNCEHAKNYVVKGLIYSLQVLVCLGLIGLGVYALAKSKN